MKTFFVAIQILGMFLGAAQLRAQTYRVQSIRNGEKESILRIRQKSNEVSSPILEKIVSTPLYLKEDAPPSKEIFEEFLVSEDRLTLEQRNFLAAKAPVGILSSFPEGSEVRTLVSQGDSKNRIDLTILGDGYLLSEKERFFEDAKRTTRGLFEGKTFSHYLPLFNIHAVFVPSNQSGLGDGQPKDTAFGLYRDPAGSKRGIMPSKSSEIERAIDLAPDTDFPIVLANDDFYGGLGGRYAISTRSVRSGLTVLRHELGHNFGQVGEEYDNGYVYSGANSSRSPRAEEWAHWSKSGIQSFESKLLTGDYVWKNLRNSPYSADFSIPQGHSVLGCEISSVGWETPDDVQITLDGKILPIEGKYHNDRSFFTIDPVHNLPAGSHSVNIQEKIRDGDNILGFALFYSFPETYDFTLHRIGAFSTFDANGNKSYRPTHKSCLMRDMEVDYFCAVDQENIWQKFLKRVSIVDGVKITMQGDKILAEVQTPALPGLRYSWYKVQGFSEIAIAENTGENTRTFDRDGKYRVKVKFQTPDVIKESSNFLVQKNF